VFYARNTVVIIESSFIMQSLLQELSQFIWWMWDSIQPLPTLRLHQLTQAWVCCYHPAPCHLVLLCLTGELILPSYGQ